MNNPSYDPRQAQGEASPDENLIAPIPSPDRAAIMRAIAAAHRVCRQTRAQRGGK